MLNFRKLNVNSYHFLKINNFLITIYPSNRLVKNCN